MSTKVETHLCPGHNWILKFGKVTGIMRSVEKEFKLSPHKYEEYKMIGFYDDDCVLVVKLVVDVWIHRVDEDGSGLTFEEWDPSSDTDSSQTPVAMIVNSSHLCFSDFDLREVIPIQLETVTRGGRRCTHEAVLKQIHGILKQIHGM